MDRQEAWRRLAVGRVATLGTVGAGKPHLVPITFVVIESSIVTTVDHKPKSTQRLRRLENVERTGVASVLVHEYSDDWADLWWVRADGPAVVHPSLDAVPGAGDALAAKYRQYTESPPAGPAIEIEVDTIRFWPRERTALPTTGDG